MTNLRLRGRRRQAQVEKPPFRVPTMDEVRATPSNGFKAVSTFSGCGGSCLGLRMAGFEVVWASEFVESARETYRLNHSTPVDERDIREVQPIDIMNATGIGFGDLDLFEGSPPCAAFSLAGKREKKWGEVSSYSDTEQRSDDLFFEYARLIEGLRPKVFVAENVRGLTVGKAKGYFIEIMERLEAAGYVVEAQVCDAQWLGVPQRRARVFIQGVRRDLELKPAFPVPLSYRHSIREAVEGVAEGEGASIAGYAIAREAAKLGEGEQSDRYLSLIRASWDEPCPTVTQLGGSNPGVASVIHPDGKRKFSIPELKRICGFPDDFQLAGSYAQQWERLGRAVPPLMMRAVASAITDGVLRRMPALPRED